VSCGPAGLQILGVQSESAGSGEVARYDITTNYGDAHIAVGADGNVYMWSDSGEDPFRPMGSNDTATINFNYTVSDGHGGSDGSTVAITVDGTNDPALILGTKTGSVTETGVNSNVAPDKVTGTLTDTDADNAPNTFQAVTNATASANGYGAFTVDASGHWAYVLDNSNAAVQALANGQTLSDNFTILTQDGTAQNITVTIHGPGNVDQQQDVADGSLSGVGATDQITITPSQGGGYDGTSLTDGAVGHSSLDWHFNASISQLAQQAGVTQVYTITDTTKPSASTTLSVSIGGPGSDQFNFSPSTGVHALVNFSTTVDSSGHYLGDSVNLQGFTNASNQPLALTDVLADLTTDSHGNAVVNLGAEGSLTFAHVSQATIQQQAEHIFKFGTATI
jgi:VCBS repeat-containing protein